MKILIVDDEPLIRWSLAETLLECGDTVTSAGTGAAAVQALLRAPEPLDVVLLDYRLPDVQNLSLLTLVRKYSPSTRVLLMTAHGTPEIEQNALALGAAGVLAKPFNMHDVPALVHHTSSPSSVN